MRIRGLVTALAAALLSGSAWGQSVHFSQYFNAPMLITPANTGLMPDHDYRLGLNLRNQWSALPVPYNTFSGWGDFKIGGNKENDHNNWLGLGFVVYSDKAGDGQLSLTQLQGNIAYHLQMSETSMISLGGSAATVARSLDFNRLIYDNQWTGMAFNTSIPSGENPGVVRDRYMTVGAGINFAFFPNEALYVRLGGGAVNINKPVESFYNSNSDANIIKLRPGATLDVLARLGETFIINPSAYYTTQSGAAEIVGGANLRMVLSNSAKGTPAQLILGAFYRIGDAAIGTVGLEIGSVQFQANYDMTMSDLAPYNNSYGALEFSLIYKGEYGRNKGSMKRSYTCPRFN